MIIRAVHIYFEFGTSLHINLNGCDAGQAALPYSSSAKYDHNNNQNEANKSSAGVLDVSRGPLSRSEMT